MKTDTVIAAHRFAFGATPERLREIDHDPRGWLAGQIAPETDVPAPLARLPSTLDDQLAFFLWLRDYRKEIGAAGGDMNTTVERSYVKALLPRYATAVAARFETATTTTRPFFERLVHFWSNHFAVSGVKPVAIALPPSYERDAIRPHVTGRFADMLRAVAKHPAMLIYLDNAQSIGPGSEWARNPPRPRGVAAQFGAAPRGLNENLAREILELHTVGVDGGYTQADVTSFAKAITGWQPLSPRQLGRFAARWAGIGNDLFYFNADAHEPGAQTIMGKRYEAGGVEQGEAVLDDLARHPQTARFIAAKLARHFVADSPPPALVERLAATFQRTDGDLAAVTRALLESSEAWRTERAKLKQPEEFLISAVSCLGGPKLDTRQLVASLNEMGQRPYMSPGPDGWPDQQDHWLSPDGLWKRIEWAELAGRALAPTIGDPLAWARGLFGDTLGEATRSAIARAESPAQGVALLLSAPEFMRR
jgi:uncharacterized protein (DUF1800 family)